LRAFDVRRAVLCHAIAIAHVFIGNPQVLGDQATKRRPRDLFVLGGLPSSAREHIVLRRQSDGPFLLQRFDKLINETGNAQQPYRFSLGGKPPEHFERRLFLKLPSTARIFFHGEKGVVGRRKALLVLDRKG